MFKGDVNLIIFGGLRNDRTGLLYEWLNALDMKKIVLLITLSLILHTAAIGQTQKNVAHNTNAWFMYFGSHKLNDKWGLHLEAQLRRSEFVSEPQQLLLRGGINYHLNSQVFFTAGYCFVETHPYGEQPVKATFPENRFWEQVQIRTQLQKIEWISRFRLEQRFSKQPIENPPGVFEPGDAVYTNRMRILNRVSIPFKGKLIADKSFYFTAYDEIMWNWGENTGPNLLDQNRLYGAFGYVIPVAGRLEIGYLLQSIFKADGIRVEQNHTFQLALFSNINFFRKQKA
jgi:Protein of unknown function (DUF2490)